MCNVLPWASDRFGVDQFGDFGLLVGSICPSGLLLWLLALALIAAGVFLFQC